MAKQSARDRNARIREQQQMLSEERRVRSLRSEDFQQADDTEDYIRNDRVVFQSMNAPEPAWEDERVRTQERNGRVNKKRRVRPERATSRRGAETAASEAAASAVAAPKTLSKERLSSWVKPISRQHEGNFSLVASVLLLCFIGLIMITSSSYYYAYNNMGNPLYFLTRQGSALLIGFVLMIIVAFVPIQIIRKFSFLVYLGSIACAAAVLLFGVSVNGSTRWLSIGPLQFQPAELVKIGVALYMAVKVEQYQKHIESGKTFVQLLILLMIPTALVAYENLTSGIIIAVIGLSIMLIGGCRLRYFVVVGLIAIAMLVVMIVLPIYVPIERFPGFLRGFLEKFMYRSNRVKAYLDPFQYSQNEGYQIVQSLYAIGSGGFFGQGLGESIQKLGFIPEAYNDIIFAIICDELGLVGAAMVITLFGILIWQGGKIAAGAPDPFTTYLSVGLITQIGLQAVLNIAVSTNSIPATGVSLPFISYGGSSIFFMMIGVGLLLNVSRYTKQRY